MQLFPPNLTLIPFAEQRLPYRRLWLPMKRKN